MTIKNMLIHCSKSIVGMVSATKLIVSKYKTCQTEQSFKTPHYTHKKITTKIICTHIDLFKNEIFYQENLIQNTSKRKLLQKEYEP